jgi:hypothetical protein
MSNTGRRLKMSKDSIKMVEAEVSKILERKPRTNPKEIYPEVTKQFPFRIYVKEFYKIFERMKQIRDDKRIDSTDGPKLRAYIQQVLSANANIPLDKLMDMISKDISMVPLRQYVRVLRTKWLKTKDIVSENYNLLYTEALIKEHARKNPAISGQPQNIKRDELSVESDAVIKSLSEMITVHSSNQIYMDSMEKLLKEATDELARVKEENELLRKQQQSKTLTMQR